MTTALVTKIDRVFEIMLDIYGHSMMVTDGVRTVSEQQADYAKGRDTPGPSVSARHPLGLKVTDCDGVIKKSPHQLGRAVDCCFIVNGQPSWSEDLPWDLYGETGEHEGLYWGGRWYSHDRPHLELPPLPLGTQVA